MRIQIDIVESGNTINTAKMLGTVPVAVEPDEFSLYVRTVGSTVVITRSDTDETIVKAVGFGKAMTALANHYGLPVIVAAEFGVKVNAKMEAWIGVFRPTTEPITSRGLAVQDDNGQRVMVKVGDLITIKDVQDAPVFEILAFTGHNTIVRDVKDGLRAKVDDIRYVIPGYLTIPAPVVANGSTPLDRSVDVIISTVVVGSTLVISSEDDVRTYAVTGIEGDTYTVRAADGITSNFSARMLGIWMHNGQMEIKATPVKHAYGRSAMVCGADMELSGTSRMEDVDCEPCRDGVLGKLRAASGELITDGMPVWDYNLNVGTVDLSTLTSDGWFNVNSPAGERMSLMNGERVTSRHPASRMLARDALSALVNVVGEIQRRETARAIAVEEASPVEGDWIYRGRDGAAGRVVNVNQHGRLAIDWRNGNHTSQHWDVLQSDGYERVTAADYPVSDESDDIEPCCNECVWNGIESQVWAGTGTLVKPSLRANLNRRKRKASKAARKRNRGGK